MATVVKIKGSGTASSAPTTSDLDYRELALNYADKKLYFKNSTGAIDFFAGGGITESEVIELVTFGQFPTGDYGDFSAGLDAFGVSTTLQSYDAAGASGSLKTEDLGTV